MEIFANRGFSAVYPENTLLALSQAVRAGAQGVQVDIRLTRDEEIILMRDRSVDRTTDGTGNVDQLTLAEIQRLDAGAWRGIAYENEPVPTLAAALNLLTEKTKMVVVFKPDSPGRFEALIERLGELVLQSRYPKNVIVASKAFRQITLAKSRIEEISSALMPEMGVKGILTRHLLKHSIHVDAVHYQARNITPGLVRNEHICRRLVRAYVGIDSFTMLQMQKAGVDGMITEDPLLGMVYSN